jgi:CRISPR-associated Csh1 family protein
LITAIAELGKSWQGEDISALVARTTAKHVIVLRVWIEDSYGQYLGASLEENQGAKQYLYGKSPHWPGLFITGRLPPIDIRKVKAALRAVAKTEQNEEARKQASEVINDFQRKKIGWVPRGTILSSQDLVSMLPEQRKSALLSLKAVADKEIDRITKDVLKILDDYDPEEGESWELLLTFKLVDDSGEYFVGEIPEYRNIFRRAMTRPRTRLSQKIRSEARCTICSGPALAGTFEHPPLPFFTLDKPNFIPSGDPSLGFKVFPLCEDCYMDLRRGRAYVEQNLDFSIPNPNKRGTSLRFWLIPILNDPSLVQAFLNNMKRGGLYLKNLKSLCETMEYITQLDTQSDTFESFLSFTALFYTVDRQGHMRIISSEQGIFPKRLRQIVEVKTHIDILHPFRREDIRFGFPLLREFIEEPKNEGWYPRMASLLSDIFLGTKVNADLIYNMLAQRIRERASKAEPEALKQIVLRALAIMDFLSNLELVDLPAGGTEQMSYQVDDPMVDDVRRFLNAHSKLLGNDSLRAVCAIGVSVGILLEVQRRRPGGSMPFWGRLNRLEIDLDTAQSFFPQVVTKLHQYDEHRYDQLLNYLGAEEVSKLDPTAKELPRDLVSLVFAVGLSEGHMTFNLR